jgi:SAM-dependent methyltransferase
MAQEALSRQTDPDFLVGEEYDDAAELNTRIQIQERFGGNSYGWFHWVFDRLQLEPEARIFDLGGGSGVLWLENEHRLPAGWRIIFGDLSPGMVAEARQRLAHLQDRFSFLVADAAALPAAGDQFDAAIALGLFDHLPHRRQALAGCWRVLKPGGRLYASAGSRRHLAELEGLVGAFTGEASYGGDPERFGMENGAALLRPWFAEVCCARYEDRLFLRELKPILAYVLSEAEMQARLAGPRLKEFARSVQDELLARGEIQVTIEKCLFTATKGQDGS